MCAIIVYLRCCIIIFLFTMLYNKKSHSFLNIHLYLSLCCFYEKKSSWHFLFVFSIFIVSFHVLLFCEIRLYSIPFVIMVIQMYLFSPALLSVTQRLRKGVRYFSYLSEILVARLFIEINKTSSL